jgi:hypothetical protein
MPNKTVFYNEFPDRLVGGTVVYAGLDGSGFPVMEVRPANCSWTYLITISRDEEENGPGTVIIEGGRPLLPEIPHKEVK